MLAVAHGKLTLGSKAGLTVTGNGSGSVGLSGAVSAINSGLSGLSYAPNADYNGSDTLSIFASPNSNTGTGGAQTAQLFVPIIVNPVDDLIV